VVEKERGQATFQAVPRRGLRAVLFAMRGEEGTGTASLKM